MVRNSVINSYRQASSSEALCATPHRLIQMLLEGAMDGIAKARGAIVRKEFEQRHKDLTWSITVIESLRGALDFKQGGEIATNLDRLYDYMVRRLYDADVKNDSAALDEVADLLKEVKSGWDAMPETLKNATDIKDAAKKL